MTETVNTILKRRSIRKFTDQKIDEATVKTVLSCGMSGPTAVNARDWSFIVVDDREILRDWALISGRGGRIMAGCALAIMICADGERAVSRAPDFRIIDGSIAGQNMILAAESLGLGSVWLGVWPVQERIQAQKEYFSLPETVTPHSIIAFGYPDEDKSSLPHPDYEESRVHYNKW